MTETFTASELLALLPLTAKEAEAISNDSIVRGCPKAYGVTTDGRQVDVSVLEGKIIRVGERTAKISKTAAGFLAVDYRPGSRVPGNAMISMLVETAR